MTSTVWPMSSTSDGWLTCDHESLGDVDQSVHAVEVDERAEVDDVRDLSFDDVAGLELVEDLLPLLLALLFEHGAA